MTNPAAAEQDLQDELSYYTLAHGDPEFVHQHIVDAFAAQLATPNSKPIQVVFALIGLYLHQERGFTGRQVQLAHMRLERRAATGPCPCFPSSAVRSGWAMCWRHHRDVTATT